MPFPVPFNGEEGKVIFSLMCTAVTGSGGGGEEGGGKREGAGEEGEKIATTGRNLKKSETGKDR